ncbi:MAG: single-stranded DNA-binding protein [Rhodanobacter sp.]|nr:MAG: single-stranded DNA-binding protein [Rhodanobacter sp.]TAM09871.1 MAG: single-stranded DNA-binding protein [Rhodanobacter sp.]TAM36020.1 MAG: single-stranded DNA-binding protein [Rhodanobacter sp.]
MPTTLPIIRITRRLARDMQALDLHTPSHVYNPLRYAWDGHHQYLDRYGAPKGRVLLVGMNPGPWGMAQTGVPFGDVIMVRDWFHIDMQLARTLPAQHPKYPILGMACHRGEGSGSRVWRWARDRLGPPEAFFERFFVWNYCPLLFLKDGRNLIPEKLTRAEHDALTVACDHALKSVVRALEPQAVVGIGRYAERRINEVLGITADYLPHPSPANPKANKEWPAMAEEALKPWLPRGRVRAG